MSEVIVRMTSDHIKVKNGEYVQDLVRCGECDHAIPNKEMGGYICLLEWNSLYNWKAGDFCSYGERNEQC